MSTIIRKNHMRSTPLEKREEPSCNRRKFKKNANSQFMILKIYMYKELSLNNREEMKKGNECFGEKTIILHLTVLNMRNHKT